MSLFTATAQLENADIEKLPNSEERDRLERRVTATVYF